MPEYELKIDFISDWHIGSGLGDGAIADSILNRDANGLPWIPGRAIKGALREGAWRLALCRKDLEELVSYLWGSNSQDKISNQPGRLAVGPGKLPDDLANWLLGQDRGTRAEFVSDMTIIRKQTALDANRMVKPHSLRAIECGIPGLYFTSSLSIEASELKDDWLRPYLAAVCASVKSIGGDRARGLGRCKFSIGASGEISLPPLCPTLNSGRSE